MRKDKFENKLKSKIFITQLERFMSFVRAKGYSNGMYYKSIVAEMLFWMEQKGIISTMAIKQNNIQEYFNYLIVRPNRKKNGTLGESSIKNHLYGMSLFFDNLLQSGELHKSYVIPRFHLKRSAKRNILSIKEIEQLYNQCNNHLERMILTICYGCGLRRTEAERLNLYDIRFSKGTLIVKKGKYDKRREIPLSDRVLNDIKEYVFNERDKYLKDQNLMQESFFVTTKGNRMKGDTLNEKLKSIIDRTGNDDIINKDITLHCLRHSISTHLLENEAGFEQVKEFLGHCEIDTTQLYVLRRKKRKILPI